jgi:8-oxo-dGTP pyrophosphatase MutT (NUDIX family)
VTDWLAAPDETTLMPAGRLRLREIEAPPLTAEERELTDRVWADAVRASPRMFDGPVAACGGLWSAAQDHGDPDGAARGAASSHGAGPEGGLVLDWIRATYRHYLPRAVPGATCWLPHLYVSVAQPTDDGRLLVGRMAPWTAAPGRWQLPSGTSEPPAAVGEPLTIDDLRVLAAREMAEEVGAPIAPEQLDLHRLILTPQRDVGVLFAAPPRPAGWLRERYASLAEAERSHGHDPELDAIGFVADAGDLAGLGGPCANYLAPVLREYTRDRGEIPMNLPGQHELRDARTERDQPGRRS